MALATAFALCMRGVSAWISGGVHENTPGGPPQYSSAHVRPELIHFPYDGRGDSRYSFQHPFRPSMESPIDGWAQLGTTLITQKEGRDIVQLTNAAQGNQGVLYNVHHTETNDLNGYFDILLKTDSRSHEPADGMGFFFTESIPRQGSAMGMDHAFRGLGIIIDIFSNSRAVSVPYLYAYVSNGDKEWNPNTDGSDVELTHGCKLELNRPTRVFFQLLDNNLHVAISMNNNHDRWHTCFKYNNVPMPFKHGGYLSFTAETGYYFAMHDVYSSAFIVGDIHHDPAVREQYLGDLQQREQQERDKQHRANARNSYYDDVSRDSHQEQASSKSLADDHYSHAHDAGSAHSDHSSDDGARAHDELSFEMDTKIHQLYSELSDRMRSATSAVGDNAGGETIRQSLDAISTMTSHMFRELERQIAESKDAIRALGHLKTAAVDLQSYSHRFSSQITMMHDSLHELRQSSSRLRAHHEDTQRDVRLHSDMVHSTLSAFDESRPHGFFAITVFLMAQALLVAGFAAVYKMGGSARKWTGRMV